MSALDVANRLVKVMPARVEVYTFSTSDWRLISRRKISGKAIAEMDTPWSGYFQQDTVALAVMPSLHRLCRNGMARSNSRKNWRYVPSATVSEVAGTENLTQAFGLPVS